MGGWGGGGRSWPWLTAAAHIGRIYFQQQWTNPAPALTDRDPRATSSSGSAGENNRKEPFSREFFSFFFFFSIRVSLNIWLLYTDAFLNAHLKQTSEEKKKKPT